jgi:ABC-2 type transport system permease protein
MSVTTVSRTPVPRPPVSRPGVSHGAALARLTITELKMFARDRSRWIRLAIPLVLMVIFGSIPFYTQHRANLGGYTLFDDYLPILVAYALGMIGLTNLAPVLAGYREKGVLRRLRTTPAGPVPVLAAQFITHVVALAVMIVVIVTVARLGYGTFLPREPGWFVLSAALATAALLGVGLLIAAVASTSNAAGGIGLFLFFPLMFFAGLFFPIPVMPHILQDISRYTPLGAAVQALQDSWQGHWPDPAELWTMAAYAVGCGLAAVRLFRWE